jgi:molecular chaperone GrpE (heat shock protein)
MLVIMANNRIIQGKDTLARIQEAWDFIILNGNYPTVTEFSKMAKISYSTFTHNYKDWADEVRKRRDVKRGTRKLSPAALPKKTVIAETWHQAEEQINELQKDLTKVRKKFENSVKELKETKPLAAKSTKLETENSRLLGVIDYLYSQLKMRGVTNEQLQLIIKTVQKHIFPVN